jgi:RNA polymerase sigma-70 factor (ECF subfamily)
MEAHIDEIKKPSSEGRVAVSLHGRASTVHLSPRERSAAAVNVEAQTLRSWPMNDILTRDDLNDLMRAVARDRDRIAFRQIFEYFSPRVKALIQRQGAAPDVADEIVQETMVNIWRKAGQFDAERASAATWVFTIARNQRIDLIRKANRPTPDMEDPSMAPAPEKSASETMVQAEEATSVRAAIADLPAEQREIIQHAFFEDKTHIEVAQSLDLPLGTVKSRIRLAMKRIKSRLGEIE